MKIPNADRAYIDRKKIESYTLNPEHPYGKHKARVFAAGLGLGLDHVDLLYDNLMNAVQTLDAQPGLLDENGQRYTIEFEMTGPDQKTGIIRSAWNVRPNEDFPRYVTAYVVRRRGNG
jgi:hypothetical protein